MGGKPSLGSGVRSGNCCDESVSSGLLVDWMSGVSGCSLEDLALHGAPVSSVLVFSHFHFGILPVAFPLLFWDRITLEESRSISIWGSAGLGGCPVWVEVGLTSPEGYVRGWFGVGVGRGRNCCRSSAEGGGGF